MVYLLQNKSMVFSVFQHFVAASEAHFGLKVAKLLSDNGGEFISGEMINFTKQKGIE